MRKLSELALWSGLVCGASYAFAVDIPGGQTETAESLPANTYQLLLSPAYLLNEGGAYLSGKIRYQPNDRFGVGFVFGSGSGELGFQFGVEGIWHAFPQSRYQPAAALHVSGHFDRVARANFFALEVAPIVSQRFHTLFGELTPYGGLRITPSFGIGQPLNQISLKTSVGGEWVISGTEGLQVWSEVGIALVNSLDEIVVGLSYPFAAL